MSADMSITKSTREVSNTWFENFRIYANPRLNILEEVINFSISGNFEKASELLIKELPFVPHTKKLKKYYSDWSKLNLKKVITDKSPRRNLSKMLPLVYQRDFYQCRYSGVKLLSLEAIDMLKTLYFEEFPLPSYNGAFSITHIDAWTFYPQADHQKPLCQGFNTQANNISNLVTCSSVLNIFIKNKLSIDDIDAMLIPIESLDNKWDGLKSKTQEFKKNRTEYFDKKCLEASKYYNERLIYAKAQKEEILK